MNRVDTRLAACAAVAAAGTALTATPAHAAVIDSGPVNINIPSTINGIYLNVVTGMAGTNAGTPGWDINPYSSSDLEMYTPSGGGTFGDGTSYFNLGPGAYISSAGTFETSVSTVNAGTPLNLNSSNNYIGFEFLNEATGATNYGYIQVSLSSTAGGQPRSIVEFSYENTGAGITVVPEPSTFALFGVMALGALGVREWRKRKAA